MSKPKLSSIDIQFGFPPGSIDRLYELEEICFSRSFRWSKEDLIESLKTSDIWIGVYDHAIVGYVIGEVDMNLHRAHIVSLNVDPEYRRKGVAAALMGAAESHYRSRGVGEIKLEVHVDNPAQVLYFNLGYRVDGYIEHYYADRSDAIGMCKRIERD